MANKYPQCWRTYGPGKICPLQPCWSFETTCTILHAATSESTFWYVQCTVFPKDLVMGQNPKPQVISICSHLKIARLYVDDHPKKDEQFERFWMVSLALPIYIKPFQRVWLQFNISLPYLCFWSDLPKDSKLTSQNSSWTSRTPVAQERMMSSPSSCATWVECCCRCRQRNGDNDRSEYLEKQHGKFSGQMYNALYT